MNKRQRVRCDAADVPRNVKVSRQGASRAELLLRAAHKYPTLPRAPFEVVTSVLDQKNLGIGVKSKASGPQPNWKGVQ
jgi:hypothetical protein